MADRALSRRALLRTLPFATAAAIPAVTATASAAATPDTAALPEGIMLVTFDGEKLRVDMNDLPDLQIVPYDESPKPGATIAISQPREGTRYLCVDWYGRMLVSELVEGNDYDASRASMQSGRNKGWRRVDEQSNEFMIVTMPVTVIGAVVSAEAAA